MKFGSRFNFARKMVFCLHQSCEITILSLDWVGGLSTQMNDCYLLSLFISFAPSLLDTTTRNYFPWFFLSFENSSISYFHSNFVVFFFIWIFTLASSSRFLVSHSFLPLVLVHGPIYIFDSRRRLIPISFKI